jgi:glycosyltransferase involved in cell wall biosynthesis
MDLHLSFQRSIGYVNLVSIIIAARNEEKCTQELGSWLAAVIRQEPKYLGEVMIVDNGLMDNTWIEIHEAVEANSAIKGLKLSQNFLMNGGIIAGPEPHAWSATQLT